MPFKIRSTVLIRQYPEQRSSQEAINHIVFTREKGLATGAVIKTSGSVARDVEAKDWQPVRGRIRVIDDQTLGIKWKLPESSIMQSSRSPEAFRLVEKRAWTNEREIKGQTPLTLADTYTSEPEIPEIFTLADKLQIGGLTKEKLKDIEGIRQVVRKTELIYELEDK